MVARPDISVVVPTHGRSQLLPRMIAALQAQTLARDRFEVIIVDDASSDSTPAVLASLATTADLHVRILRQEVQTGPAHARNWGWRSSEAPLVAFIDDDCRPDPGWLEAGKTALDADLRLGVVQGATHPPEGVTTGDWTMWRQVVGPTPYFEACNIFYRRSALDQTHGFDEDIAWFGEDAALGWAVVERGWAHGFAPGARVIHDVSERGLAWHVRHAYLEKNVVLIGARHPSFRDRGMWRRWAIRPHNAAYALGLAGIVGMRWWRPLGVLVLPYAWLRRPPPRHHRYAALALERLAVDTAQFVGMVEGSLRHRVLVI